MNLQDNLVKKGTEQTPMNYWLQMNNVDIKITQNGWTKVPIVEVNKLKVRYSR